MILIICAIKDNAVDAYERTFEVRAQGEAMRMFKDEANNPESRIGKHPEDFELYKVAMWEPATGKMEGMTPERIARAIDLKGI